MSDGRAGDAAARIENVADTARWMAGIRAAESKRPDALFRDPFADRLAGDRGHAMNRARISDVENWWVVIRTLVMDEAITSAVEAGADTILNLGAGFDVRPYRLELPPSLRWFEVDAPELLEEKKEALSGDKPRCKIESIAAELTDAATTRELCAEVGRQGKHVAVVTEGLLLYLRDDDAASLGRILAGEPSFRRWLLDYQTSALLKRFARRMGSRMNSAPFRFVGAKGLAFFTELGWRVASTRWFLRAAREHGRLGFLLRLASMLPDSKGANPKRTWSGLLVLDRNDGAKK